MKNSVLELDKPSDGNDTIHLSPLEGGSVRRGGAKTRGILPFIAKSTPSRFGEWSLPGHGESYSDCGSFGFKGCLNVEAHRNARLDGVDVVGKVYVKKYRRSCGRAECPICYEKWASKEAHRIEHRLGYWKKGGFRRPIHVVFSPPLDDLELSYSKLRQKLYRIARKVSLLGGCVIFHPFRENEGGRMVFSPHFHALTFGWVRGVREVHLESGWVIKNLGVRKSVHATAMYQLSHAGVHPKRHTVTWFGRLSYNQLRVPKLEMEKEVCPLCGERLVSLVWMGGGDPPVGEKEAEYFVDPGGWSEKLLCNANFQI